MSRLFLYISLLFLSFSILGQQEKKPNKSTVWKQEREAIHYQKGKKYKGPDDWYTDNPGSMQDESESGNNYNSGSNNSSGSQYSPQQIKKNRQRRNAGFERGGGAGDGIYDPEIERPDPIELPDVDTPDIDPPNLNLDPPTIPVMFWKVMAFLIIFAVLIFVIYHWLKNRTPNDKKVILPSLENDWNPEVITKTELELLLEKCTADEDYRECIRIYFTFILKEIIKNGWIKWKQEKTNFDYILEMKNKPESYRFEECVRIYDLVWYGEYEISREVYLSIQPTLLNYYQSLQTSAK